MHGHDEHCTGSNALVSPGRVDDPWSQSIGGKFCLSQVFGVGAHMMSAAGSQPRRHLALDLGPPIFPEAAHSAALDAQGVVWHALLAAAVPQLQIDVDRHVHNRWMRCQTLMTFSAFILNVNACININASALTPYPRGDIVCTADSCNLRFRST